MPLFQASGCAGDSLSLMVSRNSRNRQSSSRFEKLEAAQIWGLHKERNSWSLREFLLITFHEIRLSLEIVVDCWGISARIIHEKWELNGGWHDNAIRSSPGEVLRKLEHLQIAPNLVGTPRAQADDLRVRNFSLSLSLWYPINSLW